MSTYLHEGSLETAYGNNNIKILEFSVTRNEVLDIESPVHIKLRFFNYIPNINLDTTFELRTTEELVVFIQEHLCQ